MKNKNYTIFFGAAGAGKAYSEHTSTTPDYFIDNDNNKWESELNGVEIKPPSFFFFFLINQIDRVVITTGYVKSVLPQLLEIGVPRNKIEIPPKSLLGSHPFISEKSRIEAAKFLNILMSSDKKMCVIAVGGTALGFCRDFDFIKWDFDFDLFASLKFNKKLFALLKKLDCSPFLEDGEIKAEVNLSTGDVVPFSIKFFDSDLETYKDIYEDHAWEWPTEMFSNYSTIEIHGFHLNVPNPQEKYLKGIYGKNWKIPNPDFGYDDYGKP